MSPSRGLWLGALWMASLALVAAAAPASAQDYETARRAIDLSPDPLARSPRLLGMGKLTLAPDPNNRLTLWDFAADPTGILDHDSVSTIQLWPSTASASGTQSPLGDPGQREYLAARETRMAYEALRRTESGNAYGFYGDLASFRLDRPFDEDTEKRGEFQVPRLVGVLNGRMPFFQAERMRYALRLSYASEKSLELYRGIFRNGTGEYLGKPGDIEGPPDFFTPDEVDISTTGGSVGLSYRFASWLTTSLGGDITSSSIRGENSGLRHFSGTGEDRPYYVGRGTVMGSAGNVEWIHTFRTWTSSSEDRWIFTLAGGINQEPLAGRGRRFGREEEGTDAASRIRMTWGSFEAGATWNASAREISIDPQPGIRPSDPPDPSSYNYFRNVTSLRSGADSLALPDSIVISTSKERFQSGALGASWRLPGGRGLIGVEFHRVEEKPELTLFSRSLEYVYDLGGSLKDSVYVDTPVFNGSHRRKVWDVRGGLEYQCTDVLRGRVGYIYRSDDRDEGSLQNEFVSNTITAGLGLGPRGTSWGFEAGYAIEWLQPDYVDPAQSRESRQQLAVQVGWKF